MGCNWSFWDKPVTAVRDWLLEWNSLLRGAVQQQNSPWGGVAVPTGQGTALIVRLPGMLHCVQVFPGI